MNQAAKYQYLTLLHLSLSIKYFSFPIKNPDHKNLDFCFFSFSMPLYNKYFNRFVVGSLSFGDMGLHPSGGRQTDNVRLTLWNTCLAAKTIQNLYKIGEYFQGS